MTDGVFVDYMYNLHPMKEAVHRNYTSTQSLQSQVLQFQYQLQAHSCSHTVAGLIQGHSLFYSNFPRNSKIEDTRICTVKALLFQKS